MFRTGLFLTALMFALVFVQQQACAQRAMAHPLARPVAAKPHKPSTAHSHTPSAALSDEGNQRRA
jgi:hypothetical protein